MFAAAEERNSAGAVSFCWLRSLGLGNAASERVQHRAERGWLNF
jgi:hypothetical protein